MGEGAQNRAQNLALPRSLSMLKFSPFAIDNSEARRHTILMSTGKKLSRTTARPVAKAALSPPSPPTGLAPKAAPTVSEARPFKTAKPVGPAPPTPAPATPLRSALVVPAALKPSPKMKAARALGNATTPGQPSVPARASGSALPPPAAPVPGLKPQAAPALKPQHAVDQTNEPGRVKSPTKTRTVKKTKTTTTVRTAPAAPATSPPPAPAPKPALNPQAAPVQASPPATKKSGAPVAPAAKTAPAPAPAPKPAPTPAKVAPTVPAKPATLASSKPAPVAKPAAKSEPASVKAAPAPAPKSGTALATAPKAAPAPTPAAMPAVKPEPAPVASKPTAVVQAAAPPAARPAVKAPRAAATRAKKPVPPILLEGDYPPVAPVGGPGQRYVLGPTPPEGLPAEEEPGELPEAYGTQRLLLTARDPQWLYAHWDLTREQQSNYNKLSAEGHLTLRVFVDELGGKPVTQVQVHPESRHWFVHVGRGGTKYVSELGYVTLGGQWISIATSGATLTPPESLSEDTSVQFATLPLSLPLPQLATIIKALAMEHLPLVQAIEALRRQGHVDLPELTVLETHAWTPEQEQALAELINIDQVRRVWIGSLEITELIRRKVVGELSSRAAAQMASPVGGFGSVASPFGGQPGPAKGFWFNVNAELIIYGATETDATVTIGGRKIRLRPDGSFSCRFALPDGQYPLPAVATAADGTDTRWADLHFVRATQYGGGEVGSHPQAAALKPPKPEHL